MYKYALSVYHKQHTSCFIAENVVQLACRICNGAQQHKDKQLASLTLDNGSMEVALSTARFVHVVI
jgi:hypothetical protein